jgi:hypothetical protein
VLEEKKMENINEIAKEGNVKYYRTSWNEKEHINFYRSVQRAMYYIGKDFDITFLDTDANYVTVQFVGKGKGSFLNGNKFIPYIVITQLIKAGNDNNFRFIGIEIEDDEINMKFVDYDIF